MTSLKSNYPVGIVSERDLVRNYRIILNKNTIKVKDVMTKNIIFCNKNTSSKELMDIMSKNKIRHIFVKSRTISFIQRIFSAYDLHWWK